MPKRSPFPALERWLQHQCNIDIKALIAQAKVLPLAELNDDLLFAALILDKINQLDIKIADLPNPDISKQQRIDIEANVSALQRMRERAFGTNLMQNKQCPLKNILAFANVIHRQRYGNCLEMAILGFSLAFSEMLKPEARPRSLSIIFFGGNEQSHFAFTIGDEENTIICDPWSNLIMRKEDLIGLQQLMEEPFDFAFEKNSSVRDCDIFLCDNKRGLAYNNYFALNISPTDENSFKATCTVIDERMAKASSKNSFNKMKILSFDLKPDKLSARQFNYYLLNRDVRAISRQADVLDNQSGSLKKPNKKITEEEFEKASTPPQKRARLERKKEAESVCSPFWDWDNLLKDDLPINP